MRWTSRPKAEALSRVTFTRRWFGQTIWMQRYVTEIAYEGLRVEATSTDGGRSLAVVTGASSGIGAGGDFARDTDHQGKLRLIDLNVRSTVHLAKLALGDMADRPTGRVLFTSSIASTMPGVYQAVYIASSHLAMHSREPGSAEDGQ